MNELELIIAAIAIALLLMIILIILIVRRRVAKKAKSIEGGKTPEKAVQVEEKNPANKPIIDTGPKKEPLNELQAKESLSSPKPDSALVVEIETNESLNQTQKDRNENLPEDSMLRRHYLTNLRTMIESLKSPRPTDAALSAHYDAMINTEVEQCLSEKGATERLISNYQKHIKTLAQQIQEPKTIAKPLHDAEICNKDAADENLNPKLPEDSMLRRHYLTNLYALVESNMPLRPTDSVLRRHYDTMINAEVNKLLGCNN